MDLDILSESLYNSDMPFRRNRTRLSGDNPLLRARYRAELGTVPSFHALEASGGAEALSSSYRAWLEHHGIDPDTGKMTAAGLAFFNELLLEQNARNVAERRRRRRLVA